MSDPADLEPGEVEIAIANDQDEIAISRTKTPRMSERRQAILIAVERHMAHLRRIGLDR